MTSSETEKFYSQRQAEYGDTPGGVLWRDQHSQDRRLRVLVESLPRDLGANHTILDFGCGTGQLLEMLLTERRQCTYVGYDLAAAMIETAKSKFPGTRFERRDILEQGIDEDFDFVVASGPFHRCPPGITQECLRLLWKHTRRCLSFNMMSSYVDYEDPELYYAQPEKIFAYCKSLGPLVTLRNDYQLHAGKPPYEFTVYIRRFSS